MNSLSQSYRQRAVHFDTLSLDLIQFKNHRDWLEMFSYNVVNFKSEPAPQHLQKRTLKAVIADRDTLGKMKAWAMVCPSIHINSNYICELTTLIH